MQSPNRSTLSARIALLASFAIGSSLSAQSTRPALAAHATSIHGSDSTSVAPPSSYWRHFAEGFIGSILLHETGHIVAAYAVGGHPSFGLDAGRPTVYSGIDADSEPHKQFIFSSAGLTVQMLLDEMILDVPHARGSPLERGVLTGGIATVAFYATIGRNASVSDVTYMARTSSLSKGQVSLIYGAVAALQAVRISRDQQFAHFFAEPQRDGRLAVGLRVRPEAQ